MRNLSRVFFRCLSFLLIFSVLLPTFTSLTHAQTLQDPTRQYILPNVEENVSLDQHTFVQSLFLEIMLAIQCQLTGIDLADPTKSCLGVNPKTGKIGYAPTDPNQQGIYQFGGLLGVTAQGIGALYTPTFGSQEYFQYMASNFGIVKPTYAEAYTGFDGLSPVLALWRTTRDISYYLLVIAFIFIGLGVMLRVKIDPRTVMTIQNQIPRVIICILLITFSYAIAGLMIDTMWAVTYMGINRISAAANVNIGCDNNSQTLNAYATRYILENPFRYANNIFSEECSDDWGVFGVGRNVSNALSSIQTDVIISFVFGANEAASCGITSVDECAMHGLVTGVKWIFSWIWFFIVLIALLIALFKIWFELVKAYIMIFLYTVLAPIWIVFGLLPKRPLGFEKWLRIYFANLAVFPCVVFILIGARVLDELFTISGTARDTMFVPPLVGNPADPSSFGAILEFGMILMAPTLLSLIREKLGVTPTKQVSAAAQTFSAGRAAAGVVPRQAIKHLNKRDQQGHAIGPLASLQDRMTGGLARGFSWIPGVKSMHETSEAEKNEYGGARKYQEAKKKYGDQYKEARENWANETNPSTGKKFASRKEFDSEHGDVLSWSRRTGKPIRGEEVPPGYESPVGRRNTDPEGSAAGADPAMPGKTAPAPTGTGPAAPGGGAQVTVRIIGPGGQQQSVPINFGAAGDARVHEVVMRSVRNMSGVSDTQTESLSRTIEAERASGNPIWDTRASEVRDTSEIQDTINTHINPTANPGGTTV